jgi:DNA/RNA endonuclease G (NUC1)
MIELLQHPQLNKGFWAKFEAWLRYLVQSQYEVRNFVRIMFSTDLLPLQEMVIITGPVFAPTYMNGKWVYFNQTIGTFPRLVNVPTHFFKVQ